MGEFVSQQHEGKKYEKERQGRLCRIRMDEEERLIMERESIEY